MQTLSSSNGGFTETVVAFLRDNQYLADPLVFILGFAEGIPVVSLFVPSSALFLAVGSMQGAFGGNFISLWVSATAGAILGDLVTYGIGRYFKDDAQRVWPLSRRPELLIKGRAMIDRWGILAILAGKFLGFMRPFLPITAGVMEMNFTVFCFASVLSSLAWSGVFLAPGFGLGQFATP
nr:SNARE associated Golgi protein [uncultured bacterium]